MKHLNLLKSHDWLAGLLLTLLLLMPSARSLAQSSFTTANLEAQGWTQVTTASQLETATDAGQLFILLDYHQSGDHLAISRLKTSVDTKVCYKPLADPRHTPHEVWMITRNAGALSSTYQLRSMNNRSEYMFNTLDEAWRLDFKTDGTQTDSRYDFSVTEIVVNNVTTYKWNIARQEGTTFVGHWADNGDAASANEGVAANKASGNTAGFLIYTIAPNALLHAATTGNELDATVFVQNPSFETGDYTGWKVSDPTDEDGGPDTGVKPTNDDAYAMTNSAGDYLFNSYLIWNTNAIYQTIEGLPEGEYTVSAVLSTWEGRKINLLANSVGINVDDGTANYTLGSYSGQGAGIGSRQSINFKVTDNHLLTINLTGSSLDWWSTGRSEANNDHIDFFKMDDVQLTCRKYYFTNDAKPLPNDNTTLEANQWYYYTVSPRGTYSLSGDYGDFQYTVNPAQDPTNVNPTNATSEIDIQTDRVFFRTSASGKKLTVTLKESSEGPRFTVCSLNVDGMPNKILGIELNGDGAGDAGSTEIGKYLNRVHPDIISASEDFNYNNRIYTELTSNEDESKNYQQGTYRGGILNGAGMHGGLIRFNTDGLNMFAVNGKPMTDEDIVKWERDEGAILDGNDGQFDELINKGFRHYTIEVDPGFFIDAFCLHMDAGSRDGTGTDDYGNEYTNYSFGLDAQARESQMIQLKDYIISKCNNGRPKVVMGDTNCRYTRERLEKYFINGLKAAGYDVNDAWVEWCCEGDYPDWLDNPRGGSDHNTRDKEIVDKVIYMNPSGSNANKIELKYFYIDAPGYIFPDDFVDDFNKNRGGQSMGDHPPVYATFEITNRSTQTTIAANSNWFEGEQLSLPDNSWANNEGGLLYKGIASNSAYKENSTTGSHSELYYLMNVGAAQAGQNCWLSSTGGDDHKHGIVGVPENAFPYAFVESGAGHSGVYKILNSQGYYLFMSYELDDLWTNTGIYNSDKEKTEFQIIAPYGTYDNANGIYAYTFYNEWNSLNYNTRYFNIDDANLNITAAQNRGIWNDWYLISLGQMDEWNRFNLAYNNAKNILNVPLREDIYEDLTDLLGQCGTATYSTCKGANGLTQQLENVYAAALTYLKGQANSNTANKDGEGTWDHNFIPYDLNESLNGWVASNGNNLADSKKIVNPSFDDAALGSWTVKDYGNASNGVQTGSIVSGSAADNKILRVLQNGTGFANLAPNDGFFCTQEINDVPEGYYILSAHVNTARAAKPSNGSSATNTEYSDCLIDYQKHIVYMQYGENGKQYIGQMIEHEGGDNNIEALIFHRGGKFTLGAYSNHWFEVDDFKLTRYDSYYNAKVTDAQFSTVCLPIQAKVPDGLRAYRLVSYTKNDNSNYVTLESVDDVIPAYTPVVIRAVPGVEVVIGIETVNNEPIAYVYFDEGGVRTPVPVTEMEEYKNDHPAAVLVTEEVPQIVDGYKMFNFVWSNATATAVENNEFHGVADAALLPGDSRYVNDQTNFTYYVLSKQEVSGEQKTGMFKLRTDAGVPRFRAFVKINGSDELSVKDFFLFSFGENGSETDGVETLPTERPALLMKEGIYNINGVKMNELQRGLNIVRMSDGTVKKIILR